MTLWSAFIEEEEGSTAIEYALVSALVAMVIISGLMVLGSALEDKYDYVGAAVEATGT